jgi:chromosome partitioning protein
MIMTRIIALASQKGGPGKTTLATNMAALLARHYGKGRTLLVDCDPQANATSIFLGPEAAFGPSPGLNVYHVLCNETRAEGVIQTARLKLRRQLSAHTLDILPSHLSAAVAELELVSKFERERRLKRWLAPIQSRYDYIIVDCPPSLGLITVNVLMAATEVIIPLEPGYFPLVGLGLLRETIDQIRRQSNPQIRITGYVLMKEDRTRMSVETYQVLQKNFPSLVLPSVPRRSVVPESQANLTDLLGFELQGDDSSYDVLPEVTKAFIKIVEEVVRRGKEVKPA